jgi:hypothetical protein
VRRASPQYMQDHIYVQADIDWTPSGLDKVTVERGQLQALSTRRGRSALAPNHARIDGAGRLDKGLRVGLPSATTERGHLQSFSPTHGARTTSSGAGGALRRGAKPASSPGCDAAVNARNSCEHKLGRPG